MENNEAMVQLNKLLEDDSFNQSVVDATNAEEIKELFSQKGFEISVEDAEKMLSQLSRIKNGDTVTEEDLDQVSGGSVSLVLFCVGVGLIALPIAAVVFAIGKWYVDKHCR